MFKLNELIMIKLALRVEIILLEKGIANTENPKLKTLRAEELERVTTLYKKVNNQIDTSAEFVG